MDTEIEVEGLAPGEDTAAPDTGADQGSEPRDEFGERATKRINKLVGRAKAAEEAAERSRRRTEELERELDSERQRSRKATETGHSFAERDLTGQIERARADIRRAIAEGDAEGQADAVERMADAKAQITALKAGRVEPERNPQPAQPRQPMQAQPSAKAQAWVEDNPWFKEEPAKQKKALAIHADLVEEGYTPDSRAYYTALTERTRDLAGDDDEVPPAPPARPAAGSGVTRTAAPAARAATTKIRLTAEEQETARDLGMTVEAYAKSKAELQRSGAFEKGNRR